MAEVTDFGFWPQRKLNQQLIEYFVFTKAGPPFINIWNTIISLEQISVSGRVLGIRSKNVCARQTD